MKDHSRSYEKTIEFINTHNPFLKENGLAITALSDGHACAELNATASLTNIYGMVHGGVLATLADMAAGVCATADGGQVVTLSSSMNCLSAAKPGRLTAEASRIHAGKSTGVYTVEIFDETGERIAQGTFTMFFLHDKFQGFSVLQENEKRFGSEPDPESSSDPE